MLSTTRPNKIFINQLGPCRWHSWKPTNQNLNKCLMKVKEKAKLTHYYGFHIQRLPEREAIYNHYGGPNKGRHYLRPSKAGKQFEHHNTREGNVMHMYHQRFKSPHNTISGITLWIWTGQWGVTDPNWGYNQMGPGLNGDRSSANRVMESWGMKTVNIDDRVAPRVGDMIPHKHKLYINNFPWFKDPITTHQIGDADYGWKGEENFDYGKVSPDFNHSVMANLEAAVAAARSGGSTPKKVAATAASSASGSPSASTTAKASAPTSSSAKKAEPVAEPPKQQQQTATKAAAAATPAAASTEEKKAPKSSSSSKKKSSNKKDSDDE